MQGRDRQKSPKPYRLNSTRYWRHNT
jgi:hypothetical protein